MDILHYQKSMSRFDSSKGDYETWRKICAGNAKRAAFRAKLRESARQALTTSLDACPDGGESLLASSGGRGVDRLVDAVDCKLALDRAHGLLWAACIAIRCGYGLGEIAERLGIPRTTRSGVRSATSGRRLAMSLDSFELPSPDQLLAPIVPAGELMESNPSLRPPVIDGLLRRGETMNLISNPKFGKSWAVLNLAFAVGNGQPFFGFETTQGRVLLLDSELHQETLAHRMRLLVGKTGLSPDNVLVCNERGQISGLDGLKQRLDELQRLDLSLLVIDPLYRFLPDGCDENSNSDIMRVFNSIDEIALAANCAIASVHHATKGGQGLKSTTDVGAGAGSQSRAADTHLVIRELKTPDAFGVSAVVRSGPRVEPFAIRRDFPLFVRDDSIDPTNYAGAKSSSTSTGGSSSTSLKPTKEELIRLVPTVALDGDPKTQAEVIALMCERLLCSERAAKEAVRSAAMAGLVRIGRLPDQPLERRAAKFILPPGSGLIAA